MIPALSRGSSSSLTDEGPSPQAPGQDTSCSQAFVFMLRQRLTEETLQTRPRFRGPRPAGTAWQRPPAALAGVDTPAPLWHRLL